MSIWLQGNFLIQKLIKLHWLIVYNKNIYNVNIVVKNLNVCIGYKNLKLFSSSSKFIVEIIQNNLNVYFFQLQVYIDLV